MQMIQRMNEGEEMLCRERNKITRQRVPVGRRSSRSFIFFSTVQYEQIIDEHFFITLATWLDLARPSSYILW